MEENKINNFGALNQLDTQRWYALLTNLGPQLVEEISPVLSLKIFPLAHRLTSSHGQWFVQCRN